MRKKINAICLSHRAAPKYISARPALPSLPRQKTLLGHTEPLSAPVSPSSRLGSPDRTSLQSSTVYINLSHFPCKDFRTVGNFNKRKLLFCSACSGNNTNIKKKELVDVQETSACARSPGGAERNRPGRAQTG